MKLSALPTVLLLLFTGTAPSYLLAANAGAANAANDFDHPGRVAPRALAVTPTAEGFDAVLPACAVAAFRVEP